MRTTLSALGVLALLLIVSNPAISNTADPSSRSSTCSAKPDDPSGSAAIADLGLAAAPHCCATGAAAACRDLCKQQGPACKGTIGCRAGECVCTCSCP